MNFLAHAYLSFGHPSILTGNLITDFLRGTKKENFPKDIQTGIWLHYEIDDFTDKHPATLEAKEYLRPATGRYCGVFMDVVYDHFLARDKRIFSLKTLAGFCQHTYHILDLNESFLPERFRRPFYYMKKENWLYSYHSHEGIHSAFNGIYRRAGYLQKSEAAYLAFLQHYDQLQKAYAVFMPEMILHTKYFLARHSFS